MGMGMNVTAHYKQNVTHTHTGSYDMLWTHDTS